MGIRSEGVRADSVGLRERCLKLLLWNVPNPAVRSPREISFRLRQELGNLAMFLLPLPKIGDADRRTPLLPDAVLVASALRNTAFAAEVERIAEEILQHRFPILGVTIDTGPEIDWRRDYLHCISTGTPYFRRSPYLDFARAGDHKVI